MSLIERFLEWWIRPEMYYIISIGSFGPGVTVVGDPGRALTFKNNVA